MSFWYDIKNKNYLSDGKGSWIRAYVDRVADKMKKERAETFEEHFDGKLGRHKTVDVDCDNGMTMQQALDAEAAARVDGDEVNRSEYNALAQQIRNEMAEESAERISAENGLSAEIEEEASARAAADEELQSNITAEADMRRSKDEELSAVIGTLAPLNHASAGTTYGRATETEYGHVRIADNLNTSLTYSALSAKQGVVLSNRIKAIPMKEMEAGVYELTPEGETYTVSSTSTPGAVACDLRPRVWWNEKTDDTDGNTACGPFSLAAGKGNTTRGTASFVAGKMNYAIGQSSAVFGEHNEGGNYALVSGAFNYAKTGQFKVGYCSKETTGGNGLNDLRGDCFIIGNGTIEWATKEDGTMNYNNGWTITPSNAFRVTRAGAVYGTEAYNSTGADYAEYFEWIDGNPDNEDRRGRFVTLDGEKIRFATADDDYVLGIISANPCVQGDNYSDDWQGKYLTDIYGNRLTQKVHYEARYEDCEVTDPETGEKAVEKKLVQDEYDAEQWILNPDFNSEQEYISREERPEWSPVGFMGKLVVEDDGSCVVNGYCAPGIDGIATSTDKVTNCRVMERLDEAHVKVLLK